MANAINGKNGGSSKSGGSSAPKPAAKSSAPSGKSSAPSGNSSGGMDKETKEKIAIASFIVIMLFLALCNFGLIGKVGDVIGRFQFGVFGFLAYITPPAIVAVFFIVRKYKRNKEAIKRLIVCIILYFLAAIICDMVTSTAIGMEQYSFSGLYKLGYDSKCGGGLLSGSLAYLIHKGLSYFGLVLVLIIGIFFSLVILTQGKVLGLIQKMFYSIRDMFANSEGNEERNARREERRERKRLERERLDEENERRLLEDKHSRNDSHDDSDDDDTKIRNKKPLPAPGFNENAAVGDEDDIPDRTSTPIVMPSNPSNPDSAELVDAGGMKDNTLEAANRRKAEKKRENVSLREKFKVDERNAKRKERQRLKEESKENDSILKIVPPKDEMAVAPRYMQDMHEVFITDVDNYDEPAPSVDIPRQAINTSSYYNTAPGTVDDIPKNRKHQQVEYNGIEGKTVKAPFEKVVIPKVAIKSEHFVSTNEEFDPMDADAPTYNDYDLPDAEYDMGSEGYDNIAEPEGYENVVDANAQDNYDNQNDWEYEGQNTGAASVSPIVEPESATATTEPESIISSTKPETISNAASAVEEPVDTRSEESKVEVVPFKTEATEIHKEEARPNRNYDNSGDTSYRIGRYVFPDIQLLNAGDDGIKTDKAALEETARTLEEALKSFGVNVHVENYVQGPSVTRYEMTLEPGTKVSKILSLADDIKLSLASADVRIEAPIPGKSAVGIEVPNKVNTMVTLRTLLESNAYKESKSSLSFAVGMNIGGEVIVSDIAKMPHVLIAGTTGSGKSVCINTLIMSILYKSTPDEVQMILIDPKVVELSIYNDIPFLVQPVITDPKKASAALAWGVKEMEERYKKFADLNVRDLKGFNDKVETMAPGECQYVKLPKIVIIIDELADLMMTCGKEVEASICRLAQLARACGIHLVVATQRPSVDVITGLIKANMPSRIAFAVSQGVDSRTILDQVGAEKLLGKGDMLFYPQGKSKPERVQGAFVTDEEVARVTDFIRSQRLRNLFGESSGITEFTENNGENNTEDAKSGNSGAAEAQGGGRDELYADAGRCVINTGKGSIGFLQRRFQIGFNRAARIMDSLSEDQVVGSEAGTKAREILMTIEEFEAFLEDNGIS